ncbi:MAG: hypothetical protein JWM12_1854, partial [Ilumatobacteraceae bacterium]|nr:hypothetical protein [Ilumatobacteraceae bacterium]
ADAVGAEPATVVEVIELDVELEPAVAPDGPDATTESDVDAEPADAETATETAAAETDAGADAGVDVVIDADVEIAADGPEPDGADVALADESAHESANEASAAAPTETPTETATDTDAAGVDDLFARLRAARAASVAERARIVPTSPPAAAGTSTPAPAPAVAAAARPEPLSVFDPSPAAPEASGEVDDSPFGRRDAALTPIILACARKLKRVLADEQNDVLHSLRRTTVVTSIETVLSTEVEHGQRYIAAIATELADASVAGASSVSGKSRSELMRRSGKSATAPANDALVSGIVAPLRHRLARAVTDAAGDNGELSGLVRGIYREWKIQQIDEHLDEVVRIAFGRGALAALDPGTPVHWVHDPRFPVCADCDDNTLSGVIGAGEPFATGQACAPAHEGCRCMLATVAG